MGLRPSEQFVENVKMVMDAKNITQQRLADLMSILRGKTYQRRSINRMLNNQRRVDIDELSIIALILDCEIEDLLSTAFFFHSEWISGTKQDA